MSQLADRLSPSLPHGAVPESLVRAWLWDDLEAVRAHTTLRAWVDQLQDQR